MEELIQKIDELINEISANSVPLLLSIIGVFCSNFVIAFSIMARLSPK